MTALGARLLCRCKGREAAGFLHPRLPRLVGILLRFSRGFRSRRLTLGLARALDWTTHTYQCVHIAETDEQARDELEIILKGYQDAVDRENAFNRRAEKDDANKKKDINVNALDEGWIGTWCLYGSPETVIEHLKPYQALGIGNILCGTTTGPLTEQRLGFANSTLDLLSSKVMPAFA